MDLAQIKQGVIDVISYARKQKRKYKSTKKLRPRKYQLDAVDDSIRHLRRNPYAINEIATGLGKTFIVKLVAKKVLRGNKRGLYIAHSPSLLTQFQTEFADTGDEIYPTEANSNDHMSRFSMDSIQRLVSLRRRNRSAYWRWIRRFDYAFIDEVHHFEHSEEQAWNRVASDLRRCGCKFVAMTGTAFRYDGSPILTANHDDHIVYRYPIDAGVRDGYLSEVYALVVQTQVAPDKASWDGGDLKLKFSHAKLTERARVIGETLELVGQQRKRTCQTIIFVPRRVEAHALCKILEKRRSLGCVASMDCNTRKVERERLLNGFREGKVNVLVNVGVLGEGINLPNCDVVVMARPTRSRGRYLQNLGRGTRIYEGKDFLLVIDVVDNIKYNHFRELQHCGKLIGSKDAEAVTGPIFTQRRRAVENGRIVEVMYSEDELYTREYRSFEEARKFARKWAQLSGVNTLEQWKISYESSMIPKDIPKCPWAVYSLQWISWFDFVGNERNRIFDDFKKARAYARSLKLTSPTSWKKYCKSGNKPHHIPARPDSVYKNDYISIWDWLGIPSPEHKSFEECREYVRRLKLRTSGDWIQFAQSTKKPAWIPANPRLVFQDEFKTMGDWLGTFSREYKSFEECKKYARNLLLSGRTEWSRYCKSGEKPKWLPAAPHTVFKDVFKDFGDWLGVFNGVYCTYQEAQKYARSNDVKSSGEWQEHCKSQNKPENIPVAVDRVYKKEWISWGEFLGTKFIAYQNRKHRKYSSAKKFVQSLQLKNKEDWEDYCKSGNKPNNIPVSPPSAYKEWEHWGEWLGNGRLEYNKNPPKICVADGCNFLIVNWGSEAGAGGLCRNCYRKQRRKMKPHVCRICHKACYIEGSGCCKSCYRKQKKLLKNLR